MALDYFSGAGHAWRRFAQIRLEDLLDQRGRERTRAYITKRIARSSWGSFERRRWKYIERLFEQGQHQSRTIGIAVNHER